MPKREFVVKFAMMAELNEYECEMLDAMLEAFGIQDTLSRGELMDLFDNDEAAAFAMVQLLTREEFVAEVGKHGDYELPEKLTIKPKGDRFLKEGGFIERFRQEQRKPVEVGGTLAKLQQQNMRLQSGKLAFESDIKNLQNKINDLKKLQYLWWVFIAVALVLGFWLGHAFKHS